MNSDSEVRPRAVDIAVQILNFLMRNEGACADAAAAQAQHDGIDRPTLFRAKQMVSNKSTFEHYDDEALRQFAYDCYMFDGLSNGYVAAGATYSFDELRKLEGRFYVPTV